MGLVGLPRHTQNTRAVAVASYNRGFAHARAPSQGHDMGRLTTHILDTAHGGPAANVGIRLFALGESRELVAAAVSNSDGRSEKSLLEDDMMQTGTYELEFDIGDYFRERNAAVDAPAFLDTVVIRFSIRGDENYHVPLLVSPWSYSTYRGS